MTRVLLIKDTYFNNSAEVKVDWKLPLSISVKKRAHQGEFIFIVFNVAVNEIINI